MTKVKIANQNPGARRWHPDNQPDGSQIGINFADAWIKPLNTTLDDGTKVACKRRGLRLSVKVGEAKGDALLRRLDFGPDVEAILHAALTQAFDAAGATYSVEDGALYLEF